MILVIWIVRHALPWARFEDVALRLAFYTVNRGAKVRSTCWAAKKSVELFAALHDKAINQLKVSQISLNYISLTKQKLTSSAMYIGQPRQVLPSPRCLDYKREQICLCWSNSQLHRRKLGVSIDTSHLEVGRLATFWGSFGTTSGSFLD
jgi:hypothetical protein